MCGSCLVEMKVCSHINHFGISKDPWSKAWVPLGQGSSIFNPKRTSVAAGFHFNQAGAHLISPDFNQFILFSGQLKDF